MTGYFKSFDRALCGHHWDEEDCHRRERHDGSGGHRHRRHRRRNDDD